MANIARSAASPGSPIRWAPPGTAWAPISPCSPRMPTRIDLCLFDPAGRREIARYHAARMHRRGLARLSAGRAAPGCSTAIAPMAPTSRSTAIASTRTSCCSILTRADLPASLRWSDALFGYRVEFAARRSLLRPARQRAGDAEGRGHRRQFQLGRRPPAATSLVGHGDLRGACARADHAARRMCARTSAAPSPRSPIRASSIICAGSASPRSSCCRSTPSCRTASCCRRGLRNYWGYNTLGFFAAEPRYLVGRFRRRDARRGAPPACGRHRGDPRRRLQPHRRGQRDSVRRCRSAASTTRAITGSCRTIRATTSTTPAPATRSTCRIRACCRW